MWQRIMTISLLSAGLVACHAQQVPPSATETNASLCQMLKQKIDAPDYESTDPTTMKRKNATDQAKLLQEYDSYSCPEIVDSTAPPNQ